ncbi:hypothetical protein C2845_PM03G31120 [Panicum miliaceum]|uniref:Uncharacterized protein n=1 Tax=Panicum miliaceum TaxID=4540 RepID=A0A3L6T9U6_PANMI|nr:hypothetical protein C2845_PM03G31120 [Panicum miliaceum]
MMTTPSTTRACSRLLAASPRPPLSSRLRRRPMPAHTRRSCPHSPAPAGSGTRSTSPWERRPMGARGDWHSSASVRPSQSSRERMFLPQSSSVRRAPPCANLPCPSLAEVQHGRDARGVDGDDPPEHHGRDEGLRDSERHRAPSKLLPRAQGVRAPAMGVEGPLRSRPPARVRSSIGASQKSSAACYHEHRRLRELQLCG